MSFTGIPVAALDFYDDLELDNTKQFWDRHAEVYRDQVRAPVQALADDLAAEFGAAKLFRPYRDVRFAKDKTPYKTHQGLFVERAESQGWYLQVDAAGVLLGVGWYHAEPDRLAALRQHVDADGRRLRRVLDRLVGAGWTVGGDQLKTAPRGWPADHPHIDLLRHKTMFVWRRYDNDPAIATAGFADQVRADWRAGTPVLDWARAAAP